MRIDRLLIGSDKDSPTHQFKNLKGITVDFDQDHWVTVVIGWNGTGKSNVLEALATIFRDLIALKRAPRFAFKLQYRMGVGDTQRLVYIDCDPDRKSDHVHFFSCFKNQISQTITADAVSPSRDTASEQHWHASRENGGYKIANSEFLKEDSPYLPRYVFSYYSGESGRMYEIFKPYLEKYDKKLRNGDDPGPKRLFYAMPVHSQFVLLAFLIKSSGMVRDFLNYHMGLDPDEGIESVLFVLRQPPWKKSNSDGGDARFWNARGIVRDFISRLNDIALAPVDISRQVPVSIWNKKTLEFKYLYVKDILSLEKLVGEMSPAEFFRDLESTYVSELIEEVRIRVRLKKNDGTVTFRELSEGERQLLTVLGLLRFTAEDEGLFLLDEPDTHLNPRWCVDYLGYLKSFVGRGADGEKNSHIVLTTHNPLAIAELAKEQVQILYRARESGSIRADNPAADPRGMGFAGIVTSDMFGLGSSLDNSTNRDLLTLHQLATQKGELSDQEKRDLIEIRERLQGLDFNFASRDRLEQEYIRARFDLAINGEVGGAVVTPENKQRALDALMHSLLSSLREG
ncbi:putative ATPase [Xanthomonas arboricola]|uniref:AAA family ATPase n=1 Tax=Xanthomonas arboricola TaxID=56448 RepID=UPI0016074C17|nr:AAA family ATPase [Xanthomonas arboricola]MBB3797585.1 putative ATPase [Xanthomonas arboricola]